MSIKQKRTLSEKSIAARRENARKSRGPATPEGRQRQRDASLRHGFYSQDRDTALRALGEDPGDFDAMVRSVQEKYPPADGLEEALGMRLARAMWRMDRADRMLEGYALRQAQEANRWREGRLHAQMMRLKMTGASLQALAQSVGREHYVTTPADLAMMKNLLPEEAMKEMGDIALALLLQLQEPGEHDAEGHRIDPHEQSRMALQRIKEIFGLAGDTPPTVRGAPVSGPPPGSSPVPPAASEGNPRTAPEMKDAVAPAPVQGPQLSPAEWAKREPVRQLLENILTRQAELCEAQRTALLRECLAGPSSFERAAEIAPTHPHAALMQRMQDSSFREVWRLSSLLLKMKRQAPGRDDGEGRREGGNGRDNPTPPFSSRFHPGQGPACADVAPTLRSARADLKVSATAAVTTPVLPPRREMGENLPAAGEIGDIHDGASAEGPSSHSHPKTKSGHPDPSTSGERSKKKDGKMKAYPDNSHRINITKDEPLRVLCGQKRFCRAGAERLRGLGVKPLEAQRTRMSCGKTAAPPRHTMKAELPISNWKSQSEKRSSKHEIGNSKIEIGNSELGIRYSKRENRGTKIEHPKPVMTRRTLRDANHP